MSKHPSGVLAVYEHVDTTIDAIRSLRDAGRRKLTVITPVPNHEIAAAVDTSPSPVRLLTFLGGVTGGTLGFLLCAFTSLDWPLITNGKEILSIPPFMVIVFECTVLIGGLTNLAAMLFFAGLPALKVEEGFDPRFSEDRFGIWVPCPAGETDQVASALKATGAEEVHIEAA